MNAYQVYDFENQIEAAAKLVFADADLTCRIPADDSDDSDFQKVRPRVELVMTLGAGAQRWKPDDYREQAWKGSIRLHVLTSEDPVQLRSYLSQVRAVMATLPASIQTNHAPVYVVVFKPIRWAGESPIYRPQDGFFAVTMNYDFDFCVKTDVWSQIT
jgi:hypothetical protein